jgi:hypothetical protein
MRLILRTLPVVLRRDEPNYLTSLFTRQPAADATD